MLLDASEIASISSDLVATVCDKTCQVWSKSTTVNDGYGTLTPSYTLSATTVAGMAPPTDGQLAAYASVIGDLIAWHISLPLGVTVYHQDHLVIGGTTLEVQVISTPRSYEFITSLIASEVQ